MDPSDSPSKQSPRKLRKSYTIAQKLEIVKYALANDRNISKTSRQFNVDRKRVREWYLEWIIVALFSACSFGVFGYLVILLGRYINVYTECRHSMHVSLVLHCYRIAKQQNQHTVGSFRIDFTFCPLTRLSVYFVNIFLYFIKLYTFSSVIWISNQAESLKLVSFNIW